jgi:hypothetical protein
VLAEGVVERRSGRAGREEVAMRGGAVEGEITLGELKAKRW